MALVTVAYRAGIDVEYYLKKHLPFAEEVMVPLGLKRAEVRQYQAGMDGGAPGYALITTLYFESPEAIQACVQNPGMGPVLADIKNFYPDQPEILIGKELYSQDY